MDTSIGKLDQTVICSRTTLNIIIFLDDILKNVKDMKNCGEIMKKRQDLEKVLRKGLKIKKGDKRPDLKYILAQREEKLRKKYQEDKDEHRY